MRVEAKRTADGFLIPIVDELRDVDRDLLVLEIELVDPDEPSDYSALDGLVGLCESERTDASVNHDKIVYGTGSSDGIR